MDARLAAEGVSPVAHDDVAGLGQARTCRRSTIRTPIIMPRRRRSPSSNSLDEIDPEILRTYEKLGIPIARAGSAAGIAERGGPGRCARQGRVAVDAVFDSVSVATTFAGRAGQGRRHLPLDLEAIREYPELVKNWLGKVVPVQRQLLRHAQLRGLLRRHLRLHPRGRALPDGAVDLFPHQRREYRPVRAHADRRRQGLLRELSRGRTAPMRDENQLHAAVVELVALDDAEIKYSTI